MRRALPILPLVAVLLAGCNATTGPKWGSELTREDAQADLVGTPDNGSVHGTEDNATDRAIARLQRAKESRDLTHTEERRLYNLVLARELGVLKQDPDVVIEEHVNRPTKRPTVKAKYAGKPPAGIFLNMEDQLRVYRKSYVVEENGEDVVVYHSDLGQMTLVMEKCVDKDAAGDCEYEYRELKTVVPYAMCLDFIEQNLGKTDKKTKFFLRKVECDQDNLGHDY